jgi:intein/homing endonuclease
MKKKVAIQPEVQAMPVATVDTQPRKRSRLTKLEKLARREASQSIRIAAFNNDFGNSSASIRDADSNFYSPQLSTDFLELPQSDREKRELFRFWYTCFPPGAPVTTWDGTTVPIEEITVGDSVPNGLGEQVKVSKLFKCDISDNIVRMKVRGVQSEIFATGNHPFYVLHAEDVDCRWVPDACKSGENSICCRTKCFDTAFIKPEYIYVKDLQVGDYIVAPWMGGSKDCGLSRDKLRLLGYYAAEGSFAYRSAGVVRGVEFSLSLDEATTIAVEIQDMYFRAFGKKARIYTDEVRHTTKVVCDGVGFAKFCNKYVGCGSHEKHLHEDIVHANSEQMLEFLGAYWNGDGCFTDNSYTIDTMSEDLASQVHNMLLRLRIPSHNSKYDKPERNINGHIFPPGTVHYVSFPGRYYDVFSKYANFVSGSYTASSTRVYVVKSEYGFLHRIEELEAISYEGPVYNFEVDCDGDGKSYIAYGLATHNTHPIVGAAIDFHTDVPMSKIRLSLPKGKDTAKNKQILHFYTQMCNRVRLFQTLYDATHEYWLHGNVFIFAEDHDMTEDIPESLLHDIKEEEVGEIDYAGRAVRKKERKYTPKSETEQQVNIREYVAKNYRGWERLQILPPEQIKLEVFQYTNRAKMELIPSTKDRNVVMKAMEQSDPDAIKIAEDIPEQIRENLLSGQPIPLNVSPYDDFLCSSFCYHLAHKKSAYDDRGISLLERCHLPGTEVTVRRDGQILQVPIETLDPEYDEVLGGSGNWRKFEYGSRQYSGDIVELNFHKLYDSIRCTPDHKISVLRDNQEVQILAKDIKDNDFIRTPSIKSDHTIDKIDLYKFFSEEKWTYEHRDSKDIRSVDICPEYRGDKLILRHSWMDENPQRTNRTNLLSQVANWISSLKEEIVLVSEDFRAIFMGMGDSVYRAIIRDLAFIGYETPIVINERSKYKVKGRLFRPAKIDTLKLYQKIEEQECPSELKLTKEFGYLIGYFLGDGWIEHRKTPTLYGPSGICYCRNTINSVKSVAYIQQIINNIGLSIGEISHQNTINRFSITTDWFNRWLGRNFGHNKKDKHLPEWVFSAPEGFKIGLLNGLFDSDGWVSKYKNQSEYIDASICMTTKDLIDQLQILSYGIGLSPSRRFKEKRRVKQANGEISDAKAQYSIVFGCSNDLLVLKDGRSVKLNSIDIQRRSDSGKKHIIYNNYLYLPIKSISNQKYDGLVYSMNVSEDHSFFANFTHTYNCLRTLTYQDKLRQAQTSIASRAMTPKRVVWADKMSEVDVEALRDQIEQAIIDPDFTVVTNFEVHWDEVGSRDRLLDLSTEYDITNKLLFIGLRITESMLTGESSYSGERIHLDVMNTMYLLYRETIAEFVEQYLFAPVAEKKGFFEIDEFGNKVLLYPKLQFTRLALRDNTELQDFMFNLFQKGALPIRFILELLNIDADEALDQLKTDLFTPNDANYNEFVRAILSKAGDDAATKTDVLEKLAKSSGLTIIRGEGRFDKDRES